MSPSATIGRQSNEWRDAPGNVFFMQGSIRRAAGRRAYSQQPEFPQAIRRV